MIRASQPSGQKVLLFELNEITWRFVDPLAQKGKLPNFAEFMREGVRGAPVADEDPPMLDPWISWTTLYTGRPQSEHGVRFLEQPPETVQGPRVWDLAVDHGMSVGIYGSIMSWPPRADAKGFWVPSTFSPDYQTIPAELKPIQQLNLKYTRAHTPTEGSDKPASLKSLAWDCLKLGLKPSTILRAMACVAKGKLNPNRIWEKVSLQPLLNLDFYESLYREHRPRFSTFHSNHVAHYMHRYWRSADPTPFLTKPTSEEVNKYGGAVEFGYRAADEVLGRIWKMVDSDTVVIVASGLGQQPYVSEEFKEGRQVVRIKDIFKLLEMIGMKGKCRAISMMAPQWNLYFDDSATLERCTKILENAYYREPGVPLYKYDRVADSIVVNISQKTLKPLDMEAECVFPDLDIRCKLGDLAAVADPTPKQGYHEKEGVVLMRGPGVKKGVKLQASTNLDVAPTILSILGLPIPEHMHGRVWEEAFEGSKVSAPVPAMAH